MLKVKDTWTTPSRVTSLLNCSLRRLLENLPSYITNVKRLPTNLRDKVVDLMCKRGLATDVNIAQEKTAIIDRELTRLDVSIAALQENRLASSGCLKEENFTFFWKGKEPEVPRLYRVGFAVKNSLLDTVDPPTGGNERILSIRLATAAGFAHIFSIYAPTLGASEDIKDHFYDELDSLIGKIPKASLEQSLQDFPDQDATARWNTLSNTIYNAAITAFGKRERPNQDWYNANLHVMVPIIETKREALLAYKHNPCEKTLSALRSARSIAQRTARRCANDYWLKLCESIQNSADCGNIRGMYDGIKKAVGPTVRKMAPLKSTSGEMLTDRDK
ncbi:hypothetical protein LSAT2_006872 [Lamellibrachia satsuma]|nr:hypothetical protein LSAT2_006872 [Lamellibrachia satsuma]